MIYGGMRCATRWLNKMLNANVAGHARFQHEGWHPNKFEGIDGEWRRGRAGIYGSVGMSGFEYWLYIMRTYKPQVAFLWRDPISHARSILCHKPASDTSRGPFASNFYKLFSIYEAVLANVEAAGVEAKHWHLKHYTTKEGFVELCDSLGLPLKPEIEMIGKFNSTRPENRRPLSPHEDCVRDIIEMFPRCKAGRAEAEAKLEVVSA
jgi:hypothetical protein